ncbi:hypothetical protein ACTFH1_10070 [Staphylococcus auricularis]
MYYISYTLESNNKANENQGSDNMGFLYGIEQFEVPGYGARKDNSMSDIRSMYESAFGILKYKNEAFLLMDKLYPHSLLDFMLMSNNFKDYKLAITDYDKNEFRYLTNLIFEYINFIKKDEIINKYDMNYGHFHISFNYDPYTVDRPSSMSKKIFHIHFNYFKDFKIAPENVKKIDINSSNKLHKMMIDKGTLIYQYIYYDYYKKSRFEMISKNEINENLPPGIVFKIGSYKNLLTDDFFELIHEIHNNLKFIHGFFTNYLFDTQLPNHTIFKRLKKKNHADALIDDLDELSDCTKNILKAFISQLHELDYKSELKFLNSKKLREEHLIYDQLNYSMSLYSPNANNLGENKNIENDIYLVVQPKLFSKKGAAALPSIGDIPVVNIVRNQLEMTDQECEDKHHFQKDFYSYINGLDI